MFSLQQAFKIAFIDVFDALKLKFPRSWKTSEKGMDNGNEGGHEGREGQKGQASNPL